MLSKEVVALSASSLGGNQTVKLLKIVQVCWTKNKTLHTDLIPAIYVFHNLQAE